MCVRVCIFNILYVCVDTCMCAYVYLCVYVHALHIPVYCKMFLSLCCDVMRDDILYFWRYYHMMMVQKKIYIGK